VEAVENQWFVAYRGLNYIPQYVPPRVLRSVPQVDAGMAGMSRKKTPPEVPTVILEKTLAQELGVHPSTVARVADELIVGAKLYRGRGKKMRSLYLFTPPTKIA
jgi:hypothetical protein